MIEILDPAFIPQYQVEDILLRVHRHLGDVAKMCAGVNQHYSALLVLGAASDVYKVWDDLTSTDVNTASTN